MLCIINHVKIMKKIKLLAPLLTLSTIATTAVTMAGCAPVDPVDPENMVDVTISDDVIENVTLEKTKAEKGKRFETKVYMETPFYMNDVTVKVGGKEIVEGDIDVTGSSSQFFYDYINNTLTIKEGVIDDKVELSFEFTYVLSDTASYVPGHVPYLISNHDIYIQDTSRTYTFYLYLDFTGWDDFYKEQFPQYFCFSMNSDVEYNSTFTGTPEILSIGMEGKINVELQAGSKSFKLSGDGYGYGKDLKLFMSMQCKFNSANHFRFYGLNK